MLDTNAYSQLKRGHHRVADLLRGAEQVLLSFIVIGELLYGFRKGSRQERNMRELRAFLDNPHVAVVTMNFTTADRYARIVARLREKGCPIPSNDVWIAAHAMETGADLVSFDRRFGETDGLAWVDVSAA